MTSSIERGSALVCHYRRDGAVVPADAQQCLRAQVRGSAGGRVLDIGAHEPADLDAYRNVRLLTLIRASGPVRARARRLPSVGIEDVELEDLPFPQAAFDVVVLRFSLCGVENPEAALAGIRRVLRSSGHLVFLEHVRAPGVFGCAQDRAELMVRGGRRCHLNHELLRTLHRTGLVLRRAEWFWPAAHVRAPLIQGVASHPDRQYERELHWLRGEQE